MRSLALVVVLALAVCSSGCSLVGLGVGAAIPHYEETTQADYNRITVVETKSGESERGRLVAIKPDEVSLRQRRAVVHVPTDEIRSVQTRHHYGIQCAVIGAIIDATLLTVLVVHAANQNTSGFGAGGWSGGGLRAMSAR